MAAAFMSSPISFNPGHPPSRTDRGGGGGPPGSSKVSVLRCLPSLFGHRSERRPTQPHRFGWQNFVLPVPSGVTVRVLKPPAVCASACQCSNAGQQLSAVTARGDIDYKPSSHRELRSSGRDAPRKLVKSPPSHAHTHAHEEIGRAHV